MGCNFFRQNFNFVLHKNVKATVIISKRLFSLTQITVKVKELIATGKPFFIVAQVNFASQLCYVLALKLSIFHCSHLEEERYGRGNQLLL